MQPVLLCPEPWEGSNAMKSFTTKFTTPSKASLPTKLSPYFCHPGVSGNTYYDQVQDRHQCTEPFRCRPLSSTIDFQTQSVAEMQALNTYPLSPPASDPGHSPTGQYGKTQSSFDDQNTLNEFLTQSTELLPLYRPYSPLSCSCSNTLEPAAVFRPYGPYQPADIDLHTNLGTYRQDFPYDQTPFATTVYSGHSFLTDDDDSSTPTNPPTSSPPYKQTEDEDDLTDKPYARLIYEALMQKPGHKMMLREIYAWFIENTTKPQESGTNGWQNSIRHNLSMNQAFENDKSTCSPGRTPSRKANSMWMLTEDAVKNGVQSTTRYRKQGTTRKGMANRIHAAQRSKSGSKGGRAARRSAARLKKQEEALKTGEPNSLEATMPYLHSSDMGNEEIMTCHFSHHGPQPITPMIEKALESLYSMPATLHALDTDQLYKCEQGASAEDGTRMDDYLFFSSSSPIFDGLSKIDPNADWDNLG